jgi:hypothetical protein
MIYQPFLFEENTWIATGVYMDDQGRYHPVAGEAKITHMNNLWINDSFITLQEDKEAAFKTRYEIIPLERGKELTSWSSENQALGKMAGKFILVDDSIISIFSSEDGAIQGTEYSIPAGAACCGKKGKYPPGRWNCGKNRLTELTLSERESFVISEAGITQC